VDSGPKKREFGRILVGNSEQMPAAFGGFSSYSSDWEILYPAKPDWKAS
jgi:hypothetical protein